ncbi:MAG TPA: class I SAM-dependent methyltransferase [Bacteroidales bacterium]|nr:class I SAM-dependent methyltransferase [Bacteroidales bacterium]
MEHYLNASYNLEDPSLVSVIDELPIWAAPFGLQLLDSIQMKPCMRVLDIGFGLGFPVLELAMRLGASSQIYGLDPWRAGIKRAREKVEKMGLSNVHLLEGVAENLPIDAQVFDLIVSNNGINNVQDIKETFKECYRVMKPDSQLVFTMNLDNTFIEFYDIFEKTLKKHGLENEIEMLNTHIYEKRKPLNEVKDLLEHAKFEIADIKYGNFNYRFIDGPAMFNHFFIKLSFLDSWKKITGVHTPKIFSVLEKEINKVSAKNGGFQMSVPFATVDCRKKS